MRYCTSEIINKIDEYIRLHKDEIIADLFELVRIPSIQSKPCEGAPFGVECARVIDATASMFERNGFDTVVKNDLGYSLSFCGTGDKTIGVFCHADVVTVDDQWIMCEPFEPVIKDGFIFGRGCNDDKSGIIQTLYSAKMIRDLNLELNNRLVVFNGANEETGMKDIKSFVANEKMPDASLVPDGMYPCVYGERSIMRFEIISKNSFNTVKKFHGGDSVNILLGKLEAQVVHTDELYAELSEICKDNDRIKISTDGALISLIGKGTAKHVMDAEGGINAAWVVADVLSRCEKFDADDRKIMTFVAKVLADPNGIGLGIEHDDPTFGKLVCGNGIVRILDGKLKLTFDGRVGLSFSLDDVEKKVIETCGDEWECDCSRKATGYVLDEDNPVKLAVEDVYASVSGIKDEKSLKIAGGTYARELKNAVPLGTVAYYLVKDKPELPEGHGDVHQPDEMMNVDGFLEGIKILVCALLEIDKIL